MGEGGVCPPPRHALASTPERHTRGPLHRPRRWGPARRALTAAHRACATAFSVGPKGGPRRVFSLGEGGTTLGEAGRGGGGRFGDLDNFRKLSRVCAHANSRTPRCLLDLTLARTRPDVRCVKRSIFSEKPRGVPRPPPHAVRSIARGAGPRSEGRSALRCGVPQGPHHLVRGWAAWFDGGFRGAEQACSRTPFPSPTGGDPAPRRAATLWCAGVACACGTMRASACATAKVLVARQHAVSVPNRSTVHGCGQGEAPDHTLGPLHATACSRRARFATPSRGVLAW